MMSKTTVRRCSRAIAALLDTLEKRQHLNAAYFALAGGALTQNWDDAGLLTASNNWAAVSSIEGFSGAALSGSDPRTILGSDTPGTLQVNVNQTNPGTFTTGGPAEFALANAIPSTTPNTGLNTVALQGSGASDVPYLKLYLNATGMNNVRVRYDLIDIDGGTPGVASTQQFALQYRVGNTGSFINLDGGYVANAADQASGATGLTNSIDVTLPAAANNQSIVEVRIMTVDAPGSDQFVAVDNINVSAIPATNFGAFAFSAASYNVSEGVGSATIVVNRIGGTSGNVSVAYSTLNGSAIAPGDYTAVANGVLNFGDGVDSLSFTVPIINDTDIESVENFTISLSSPTGGAALGNPFTTTVNITDNDTGFVIDQSSYTVAEGAGSASILVRRVGSTSGNVAVSFATANGTAVAPGDYTTTTGTLFFLSGQDQQSITVPIVDDNDLESLEAFTVSLSNPTNGAGLGTPSTTTVSITDNDVAGQLAFNPTTYSVNEGAGTVTLTVLRTLGNAGAVSVNWTAVPGSATNPSDYLETGGVLNFNSGQTSATIVISIANDTLAELAEQFTVTLSSPAGGATLGAATIATVTINDNDANGPAGLLLSEVSVNPPGTNAPYQFVELRGTPNLALTDVYLLDIEGDSTQNPGRLNGFIPIAATLGSNGLLLIRSSAGFVTETAGAGVLNTTYFDAGQPGFQQGSNSFVLVFQDTAAGTFAPVVGTDFDPTNSGALTLPSGVSILDAVGTLDGNTNDRAYGAVLGPIGNNTVPNAPDAMVRFFNNATPVSSAAWFWGDLVGADNTSKTFTSNLALRSQNFPLGGILTPGGVMTGVLSVVFDYAGTSQSLVVTFTKDVAASLEAGDFELTNLTTPGAPISLTLSNVSTDGRVATLTFNNAGGLTPSILADGDYQLRVKQGQVGDGTDLLPVDHLAPFFFKNADITHDRAVNFDDLLILAQNYGRTTGAAFANGDINYDGAVNFDDLLSLAQRYGTSLVAAPAVKTTPARKRGGFGANVIV